MSVLLVTRPGGFAAARAGRVATPTAWWLEPMRWIDARLAELESGDPSIDFVRLGQSAPEAYRGFCELYRLDVSPRVRATRDGSSDQAALSLVVTCVAGHNWTMDDPMAGLRLAGAVWSLLDEWSHTEVVATDAGAARKVALHMGRARIEEQTVDGPELVRMPAVVVDNARITSGPA